MPRLLLRYRHPIQVHQDLIIRSPIAASSRKDHQTSSSQSIEYQVDASPAARLSSIAQGIQVHLHTESFQCFSIRMHEQEHIDIQTDEQQGIDTDLDEEEYLSTTTEDAEELTDLDNDALSEVASNSCSVCRRLFQSEFLEDEFCAYHPSLSSLKESVDAGCRFCEILARELDDQCNQTPSEWSIKCAVRPIGDGKNLRFSFYLKHCNRSDTSHKQTQLLTNFFLCPACKLGLGPEFSGAPSKQRQCIFLFELM